MHEDIDRAIADGSSATLASTLDGASASEIQYAARQLHVSQKTPQATWKRAKAMSTRPESSSRVLASHLLTQILFVLPEKAIPLFEKLLDDSEPAVRDAATTVAGRLLRNEFDGTIEILQEWRLSPSPSVRRAVVVAAGRAAQPQRPEWAEPLLKLLDPLLQDRDRLIRRALGPSALGGALLDAYPRLAFEYITQWSTSNDEQVLWNVAMAFSTPPAATMVKKALIILRKLSLDERRFVWRAVASAVWKLGRKCPEIVRPELARWIEDERRVEVAREALKHL